MNARLSLSHRPLSGKVQNTFAYLHIISVRLLHFVLLRLPRRLPPDHARVHSQQRALVLGRAQVLLHQLGRHADHVLALPVLDQVERLQGGDDVRLGDGGHGGEVLDAHGAAEVAEDLQQDLHRRKVNLILFQSVLSYAFKILTSRNLEQLKRLSTINH